MKQVGQEEQTLGRVEQLGLLLVPRGNLKEGIEWEELNSRSPVELIEAAYFFKYLLAGNLVLRIAIAVRQRKQFAAATDECPIDAPGVDADRF